ncbi:hypothetical protein AVEN_134310-1 [Araneus ventricosus]|uniref:Uncharacterized protein n=1 Tax=Araneus ventricosus TaxID=182803 RepID=A0A4Y2RKE4_ARAVE|nr:hypothetical protein AVEN_134310-1 [Araneus ventricosus]
MIIYFPDCNCGEYSKSCRYNWKGDQICDCFPGYAQKYGSCEECNCGPYGSCSFQYGQKTCNCRPFAFEKNEICIIMESTTSDSTTAVRTTILPSTTQYCNCGEYSKSCHYNRRGVKICDCFPGYAEKYGSCDECNCGPYGSCSFQNGRKTCSCKSFQVEINGVCVEMGTTSEGATDSAIVSSTVQECDCGPRGRCTLESGQKKCVCDQFTSEREGRCVGM